MARGSRRQAKPGTWPRSLLPLPTRLSALQVRAGSIGFSRSEQVPSRDVHVEVLGAIEEA